MPVEEFQVLGVSLLLTGGPYSRLGDVELLVNIDAIGIEVPQFPERARVTVIDRARDGSLVETRPHPNPLLLARLVAALGRVGFPGKRPSLSAIEDTGDGWERVRLHVHLDGATDAVELHLHSSGFRGPDDATWRVIFQTILRIAGQADRYPLPSWALRD